MEKKFTFIDLFSGIGGFHLGLSNIGGKCLLASDIDNWANESYKINYGIIPKGDITQIPSNKIPNHDILCAGFPCQSFSNIGPGGGLEDPRGALIEEVFRILQDKQPKGFIIENVKSLVKHKNDSTFSYIKEKLEHAGYNVFWKVLEAKDYGLPQIRKRLFIVGTNKNLNTREFVFPNPTKLNMKLSDVLKGKTERELAFTIRIGGRRSGIDNKYNWDCYLVDGKPVYLNPQDCLELQGFPRTFFLAGSKTQQYRQVGNTVPTSIIREIGIQLIRVIKKEETI